MATRCEHQNEFYNCENCFQELRSINAQMVGDLLRFRAELPEDFQTRLDEIVSPGEKWIYKGIGWIKSGIDKKDSSG